MLSILPVDTFSVKHDDYELAHAVQYTTHPLGETFYLLDYVVKGKT